MSFLRVLFYRATKFSREYSNNIVNLKKKYCDLSVECNICELLRRYTVERPLEIFEPAFTKWINKVC